MTLWIVWLGLPAGAAALRLAPLLRSAPVRMATGLTGYSFNTSRGACDASTTRGKRSATLEQPGHGSGSDATLERALYACPGFEYSCTRPERAGNRTVRFSGRLIPVTS
jgi:hypothetical protein